MEINIAVYKALQIFLLHTSRNYLFLASQDNHQRIPKQCQTLYIFNFLYLPSFSSEVIFKDFLNDTFEVTPSMHPPAKSPHIKLGKCPFGSSHSSLCITILAHSFT